MRYESYPRTPSKKSARAGKRSAAGVVAEALRDKHFCAHVEHPRPPQILWGDPATALQVALDMAKSAKDVRGRRRRSDAHILGGCVCSYPTPVAVVEQNLGQLETLQQWVEKSKQWAFDTFGQHNVRAIVQHMDETMPHLHILVTPDSPGGEPSPLRRVGNAAALTSKGRSRKARVTAHNEAGRNLQDSYFESVSLHFGHARHGFQRRRRMTRAERNIEISHQQALQRLRERAYEDERESRQRVAEEWAALRERELKVAAGEKELGQQKSAARDRQSILDKQTLALNSRAANVLASEERLLSREQELAKSVERVRQIRSEAEEILRKGVAWVRDHISPSEFSKLLLKQATFEEQTRVDAAFLDNFEQSLADCSR